MNKELMEQWIRVDGLSWIMIGLVGFIGIVVASFASRYQRGDRRQGVFFTQLGVLVSSLMVLVTANHLLLFLAAWAVSNTLLVFLMIHKPGWSAAKASGLLAGRNFLVGFILISGAFGLLTAATGEVTVSGVVSSGAASPYWTPALVLLLAGAMTQSAIWPFHRWLTSSLNSPTPVSAIMHAGLVNGGGFLLARFAPVFLSAPGILHAMFMLGLVTALVGTLWKLMQSDVKRMLACSTMGQMGFMVVQCGLGLFPAAVAHLCWHGLFKAYLFLASGGAAQEKRLDLGYPPSPSTLILSLICGAAASAAFAFGSHKPWMAADTTSVLVVVAWLGGTQFAMPILRRRAFTRVFIALPLTALMGLAYGASVHLIESVLAPMGISTAQPLHATHIAGMALLATAWFSILFARSPFRGTRLPDWVLNLYVGALNASQPHPRTVTSHRNNYRFS
jgi:NAD(P)H-quinone oxidoreductase subunit 5